MVAINNSEILADETICFCNNVSPSVIVRAIRAGARTLSDVQVATGAGHGNRCRELNPKGTCCTGDIRRILAKEAPTAGA